jgi:hypothetical protein
VIEEIPEVKYPQSYQATFGGTPGTAHMIGEGVVFVYFNHGSKTFERFKISLAHAHMVIPIEKRFPIPPQRPNPTPSQRSAQQPILETPMQIDPQQQPTLGMPIQTAPPQQSTTMPAVLTLVNTVVHTRSSTNVIWCFGSLCYLKALEIGGIMLEIHVKVVVWLFCLSRFMRSLKRTRGWWRGWRWGWWRGKMLITSSSNVFLVQRWWLCWSCIVGWARYIL